MTDCACGCGSEATPDSRGRPRRYLSHQHAMKHYWATGRIKPPKRGSWRDLMPQAVRDESSGCLLWPGSVSPEGYARYSGRYVHREVYVECVGPIPRGYQVDHVAKRGCIHRNCIEPTHLEAVPQKENIRRQPNVVSQLEKTECPKGHPYTGENLRVRVMKNGNIKRGCRTCDRESARRGNERKRMAKFGY